MTLSFDGFQMAVVFVAVLLVNYLISDGKSHWLGKPFYTSEMLDILMIVQRVYY
jgi:hypothetical protein